MTQQDLDREFELLQEYINWRVDVKAKSLLEINAREVFDLLKKTGLLIWTDSRNHPLSFKEWKQNIII